MKLYHFPPSPNSRRVLATALQLELDLELETVDLTRGEQFRRGFLKLNPNHMIPVLVDGDFVLWESTANNYRLGDYPICPALRVQISLIEKTGV